MIGTIGCHLSCLYEILEKHGVVPTPGVRMERFLSKMIEATRKMMVWRAVNGPFEFCTFQNLFLSYNIYLLSFIQLTKPAQLASMQRENA